MDVGLGPLYAALLALLVGDVVILVLLYILGE